MNVKNSFTRAQRRSPNTLSWKHTRLSSGLSLTVPTFAYPTNALTRAMVGKPWLTSLSYIVYNYIDTTAII